MFFLVFLEMQALDEFIDKVSFPCNKSLKERLLHRAQKTSVQLLDFAGWGLLAWAPSLLSEPSSIACPGEKLMPACWPLVSRVQEKIDGLLLPHEGDPKFQYTSRMLALQFVSKQWWQSVIPCWQYQMCTLTWRGSMYLWNSEYCWDVWVSEEYGVWSFRDTQLVRIIYDSVELGDPFLVLALWPPTIGCFPLNSRFVTWILGGSILSFRICWEEAATTQHYELSLFFFLLFFWPYHVACGILVPQG